MQLKELINILQEELKEKGDVIVGVWSVMDGYYSDITDIDTTISDRVEIDIL